MRILEIGAGTGRDSIELAQRGAEVVVLDFSEKSLEIVAALKDELKVSGLRTIRADALQAPFCDGSFDLVFHQGLLEHFRQPMDLLRENYRLIKPGGYCLCDVPQTFHLYTLVKHILIAVNRWFAGWETQYSMSLLRQVMESSGFEVVHTYGDWMRPCFFYRVMRELLLKVGIELPLFPFQGTHYQIWRDRILDRLSTHPLANYTQVSIGVFGRKPAL
jgi:ubiquinone/menaquinone biosynthesis C-methylase UbiE